MAQAEADLRARLADVERHLSEMPPHNASGSRESLERQRVALQRQLAQAAASRSAPTPTTLPDARVGAARAPAERTPPLAPATFRRTTHVACGPVAGTDYGDGDEVARDLHGACRDVRRHGAGLVVLGEATIAGHLDDRRVITHLRLGEGEVPPGLVGAAALPGLRRQVTAALDDATTPTAVVLLDLGIGGTLAAYGRMQAGRRSGKSSAQVMSPGAVDLLGDSCRGWAKDGLVVAGILAKVQRQPSLPPEVPDADLDGWHDLGPLPSWWVRRRRRIDVAGQPGGPRQVLAAFRDSWVDPDHVQRSLHEWELAMDLDADDVIVSATATARSLPFGTCSTVKDELPALLGTPLDDLRRNTRDLLGGTLGCTHLGDLLTTIPSAVLAAGRIEE